jgi:arsenite methyltransferase
MDKYEAMAQQQQARQRVLAIGYTEDQLADVPEEAVVSFGCGNPTALAELQPGETVLDLGSGVGLDAFLAARQVGPSGAVIGVDMTPAMVEKARSNAAAGGFTNVRFEVAAIEHLPLPDASVDAVISNCVLNHCADKLAALREIHRCLRPGGRVMVTDLTLETPLTEQEVAQVDPIWVDWLQLAGNKAAYLESIRQAGFSHVAIIGEKTYEAPPDSPLHERISNLYLRAEK